VKTDLLCIIDERRQHVFRFAPGFLIFEQLVVHGPELLLALQPGGFRGLRRYQSELVRRHERILAKDYPQLIAEFAFHFFQLWIVVATGGTLKIGKLFDRDRRVRVAANVWRLRARRLRAWRRRRPVQWSRLPRWSREHPDRRYCGD